ncbi:MAG: adenylate/guanylate cyclase domain-containing protein [Alphaproteobacteria bacterium]|nr:adenylate/guanylate cyclase domain-containing protein [Alphaproteobacteria bacterium]MCW5742635.1 adenylate/guanylate cyclase domain-containing protein [Alphaproteobacteria bacterium]
MTGDQRRLAAILAADVVGYSRLMGRDESGTLSRLRTHRSQQLEPAVKRRRGRIVKLTGDGALVEFSSAVEAVSAAIEIQQEMADANCDEAAEQAIAFRIGVHLGDLIVDGDDLYGDGVNVAARLEGEAPAGGIVISGDVHNAVAGRLQATFDDLGDLALKNIVRPLRAYRVRWSAADWPAHVRATPAPDPPTTAPDKPSIAVLPFTNMSGNPEQEYFADGVTEDIITELARFRSLLVIARNSTFTYKGKAVDVRTVGRDLGVRYVLEGSVRRYGDKVRTTAQLTDATTGGHIWAERYDRPMADVFALQDEMTSRIVAQIQPALTTTEIERSRKKPARDLTAWDLYLQALPLGRSYERSRVEEAESLLKRAIDAKPDFAAAYAKLSSCRLKACYRGWMDRATAEREAFELAERAIQLDEEEGLAHDALASAEMSVGSVVEAISTARRAIELCPVLMAAHGTLVSALAFAGRCEEAIAAYHESEFLSPRDPDRSGRLMGLMLAHFFSGNYPEAARLAREHARLQPYWHANQAYLAAALAHMGRLEEARDAMRRVLEIMPSYSLSTIKASSGQRSMIKREEDKERFRAGLRLAGVPE